ncbi:hypothetical protein KPSB59_1730020 [Klebsiella quasipneumoniae subsp. quasipneumoniae]|nr:hypothetical protein KPSB59_1730020 [Klebsiella quasipneumoniae subsp. quasipneumoniae]
MPIQIILCSKGFLVTQPAASWGIYLYQSWDIREVKYINLG